jgi:nitrogen regulatory protein P-II 2
MKYVVAIIRSNAMTQVRDALAACGVEELAAQRIERYGLRERHQEVYRGEVYEVPFIRKIKVEFAVPDRQLEAAVAALRGAASTGQSGDGRIFIMDIDRGIQISSGKVLADA